VKVVQGVLFSLFLLLTTVGFAQSDEDDEAQTWAKISLDLNRIQNDFLNDKTCQTNEREFIACIDALQAILRNIKPGYVLSTADHATIPNTAVHIQSGPFLILKSAAAKEKTEPSKLSPAAALAQARAEKKARDEVWITQRVKFVGIQKLMDDMMPMVTPKDERYLAGLSMNAFIATSLDPHTYLYCPESHL
jgi:hypothetical protein